jgi:hypothetical protein
LVGWLIPLVGARMRADLEFFPDFYILMSTLAGGLPSVLRFMLGCTPLYFGFATVGTILFGVTD